jgi:hypothetical protein
VAHREAAKAPSADAAAAQAAGSPPTPVPAPAPPATTAEPSTAGQPSRGATAVAPRPAPLDLPERLGTGHGAREYSHVTHVDFQRATSAPEQLVRIRYDSVERLVAAGVIPRRSPPPTGPRPFPGDPAPGYVPDPPTW